MWKIYGKIYDLSDFLNKHPGGPAILKACKGNDDLTASFESYHAFSDMEKIKKIMKKYEIGECNQKPMVFFKSNNFYKTLQKRVRKVLNNTKSDLWFFLKVIIQIFIFFYSFYISFYFHSVNFYYRILSSIIAGNMLYQVAFNLLHDASHMAISKNPFINEIILNIWSSIMLWDAQKWLQHHVIRHHAFTGDTEMDPDIIHLKPFIRKSSKISNKKYLKFVKYCPMLTTIFSTCIFPGMAIGQSFLYNFLWKKWLWRIKLSEYYKVSIYQTIIKLFILFSFIYGGSFLIFFTYALSQNITYAICILPDHDTFETNQNHAEYVKDKDWGEIQVRNSANFCNQISLFCNLFGGINYQIEHHLFPSLCNIHLPKIKPIVMQTCKEFNIPYIHHENIFDAIYSTLKHYSEVIKED